MKNTKVLKPKIAIIHHLPLPERHQGQWAVPPKAVTAGICITKAMYRPLAPPATPFDTPVTGMVRTPSPLCN